MFVGAHVSTAGGLQNAVERGAERGCESIQIFNQSPRMWRPTNYGEEDFAAFKEAMDGSKVEAVIIHAIYLINCATTDKELRKKSRDTLTNALRIGDGIGAKGVVLHPTNLVKILEPVAPVQRGEKKQCRGLPASPPPDSSISSAVSSKLRPIRPLWPAVCSSSSLQ